MIFNKNKNHAPYDLVDGNIIGEVKIIIMILTGQETVNANNEAVWGIFMDTEALGRIIPFVKHLEKTDEENYTSLFEVNVGPVRGSFTVTFNGDVKLSGTLATMGGRVLTPININDRIVLIFGRIGQRTYQICV